MKFKPCANDYYHLSLDLPFSSQALPGHHITLNAQFPVYVMANNPGIELIVPQNLMKYADVTPETMKLQGTPLPAPLPTQFTLLMVENEGLNACLFYLRKYRKTFKGLVLIGTSEQFPFKPCPSRHLLPQMPANVIAALPLLEDWGIPHRLASTIEMPGVYYGTVDELAKRWLESSELCVNTLTIPTL